MCSSISTKELDKFFESQFDINFYTEAVGYLDSVIKVYEEHEKPLLVESTKAFQAALITATESKDTILYPLLAHLTGAMMLGIENVVASMIVNACTSHANLVKNFDKSKEQLQ